MKRFGILLVLVALPATTGCGTALNLVGLGLAADPPLRPAEIMGGVQMDTRLLERANANEIQQSDGMLGLIDAPFSLAADIALLPLTVPIAAIVGDGPFGSEEWPKRAGRKRPVENPD